MVSSLITTMITLSLPSAKLAAPLTCLYVLETLTDRLVLATIECLLSLSTVDRGSCLKCYVKYNFEIIKFLKMVGLFFQLLLIKVIVSQITEY